MPSESPAPPSNRTCEFYTMNNHMCIRTGAFARHCFSLLLALGIAVAQEITSPEKFFGFQLGADKKMARWDKIVEYYGVLEKQSGGRMKVINMGPTSMGNPFLMVIVTAPANFAKLERLRQGNLRLR